MNQKFVIILIVLAACAYGGTALECYQCIPSEFYPSTTLQCMGPFEEHAIKCNSGEGCFKEVKTAKIEDGNINQIQMITRKCGTQSLCDVTPSDIQNHCSICTTNYCNSAITIIPSLSTMIVLYTVKFIFM